jgi:hypothetical protein
MFLSRKGKKSGKYQQEFAIPGTHCAHQTFANVAAKNRSCPETVAGNAWFSAAAQALLFRLLCVFNSMNL